MQFHRVQHPSAPLHRPGSRCQTHCWSMARGHDDDVSARLRRKLNVDPDVDPHSTTLASLPVSTARRGFGKKQPTCWESSPDWLAMILGTSSGCGNVCRLSHLVKHPWFTGCSTHGPRDPSQRILTRLRGTISVTTCGLLHSKSTIQRRDGS